MRYLTKCLLSFTVSQRPHGDGRFVQFLAVQADIPESLREGPERRLQDGIQWHAGGQMQ